MQKPLETDWIDNFEKIDTPYEIFYQEDVNYTSLNSIYIDRNNTIQKIKEEKFFFKENNVITRDELIGILKRNCFHNQNRYTLLSILKYNCNLDPSEVGHFIKTPTSHNYLSVVKNIYDIQFEKTINMFQDLNSIIILFYEKTHTIQKNSVQTKKIIISQPRKKTLRKIA
jgi:hypothetical protein